MRISGGASWSCWPALIVGLDACMPRVVCRAVRGSAGNGDVGYFISLPFSIDLYILSYRQASKSRLIVVIVDDFGMC